MHSMPASEWHAAHLFYMCHLPKMANTDSSDANIDRTTLCEWDRTLALRDVSSVMSTVYGMPYLLEDKTGKLTGSDFVDINDRLRLRLSCTAQAPTHTAYMIHNVTHGHDPSNPLIALAFGPDNSLGTITFRSGAPMPMNQYLATVSPLGRLASIPLTCMSTADIRRTQQHDEEVYWIGRRRIPMELAIH